MQPQIKLYHDTATATIGGEPLALTGTEYKILALLIKHKGKVLTRQTLIGAFRSTTGREFTNIIDVYVNFIRGKIGKDRIKTVRGQGYVFGEIAA